MLRVVGDALKLGGVMLGGPNDSGIVPDHGVHDRVVADFHDRLTAAIGKDDVLRLSVDPARAPFADWVGEDAVRALERFCRVPGCFGSSPLPTDDEERYQEELWLDFLHLAVPRAKAGFQEALWQVLENNGWPEKSAGDLVAVAGLVEGYERRARERHRQRDVAVEVRPLL